MVNERPERLGRARWAAIGDVAGISDFAATKFSQKVLHGVEATPIPAGVHEVRARLGCPSSASLFSSSGSFSLTATVLSGAPTVTADESIEVRSDDPTMCVERDDGTEECIPG